MFNIKNKSKKEIIKYLYDNMNGYKKGLDLKGKEFIDFQEKFLELVGNILFNHFLNDKIEDIDAVFLEIMKIAIAINFRVLDEGEIIMYLNYFPSNIYKKKIKAMMQFRLLDNPKKQLLVKFEKVSGLLREIIEQDDKELDSAIDIIKEYFDKLFSQDIFLESEDRKSLISDFKEKENYKFFWKYKEFRKYINDKIRIPKNFEEEKEILFTIEEKEQDILVEIQEIEKKHNKKMKEEKRKEMKGKIMKLEWAERKLENKEIGKNIFQKKSDKKREKQIGKENDFLQNNKEYESKDIEIKRLKEELFKQKNNIVEKDINISIGIILPEQLIKKINKYKDDFGKEYDDIKLIISCYGAWGKDEKQISIFTIMENDIVIVGPNDHVWKDIEKSYNQTTDGVYKFLDKEREENKNPRFLYKAIPEGSQKRPKISKSTIKSKINQGILAYLREEKNTHEILL